MADQPEMSGTTSKEETKLNFKKKATGKAPIAKKKKTDEKQQNEDGENLEFTCWKMFVNCENRYQLFNHV